MKKLVGILVVILIIIGAFLYRPQKIDEPQTTDWLRYENSELGISFSYPPEWEGDFTTNILDSTEDLRTKCSEPKKIQKISYNEINGLGYCRLFENGDRLLYESVMIYSFAYDADPPRIMHRAIVDLDNKQFEITQDLQNRVAHEADENLYLQSILDRTAPADILEKIDTFEQVILTLEVE